MVYSLRTAEVYRFLFMFCKNTELQTPEEGRMKVEQTSVEMFFFCPIFDEK